jgi:hypothetical protein
MLIGINNFKMGLKAVVYLYQLPGQGLGSAMFIEMAGISTNLV